MRTNVKNTSNRFIGTMVVGRNAVTFQATDGQRYEFSKLDGVSPNVPLPPVGTRIPYCLVTTNKNSELMYSFGPSRGTHIVRFKRFTAREGVDPAPKVRAGGPRTRKDGRSWYADDKLVFTALFEIVTGDFAGCELIHSLDYIFERDMDGTTFLNGGRAQVQSVEAFLQLVGFDVNNDSLTFTPNVLPDLEDILQERAEEHVFQVEVEDGWTKNISELAAGLDTIIKMQKKGAAKFIEEGLDEDEAEEDAPPVRKPAARPPVRPILQAEKDEDEVEEEDVFADPPTRMRPPVARPAPKVTVKREVVEDDWDDDGEVAGDPPHEPGTKSGNQVF